MQALEERLRTELAPHLLVVRELGAGGMARVFLAREPALKRLVAVKVLAAELATDAEARARFEREAQAVAGLSHPNIVAVYRVGELLDGTPYFVMQHVAGESLHARVKRSGPLPVGDARRVVAEVANALSFAHGQRIIHRDIKPANILYDEATSRALVADFGIAAVAAPSGTPSTRLTQTGAVVGTPMYMSPEQLLAEPVSDKTDVYSLGLLAHELLAGSPPFSGTTPNELIAAHLRDVPRRLSERREDVDPEFDALIARCLEKAADKRPSADEVARWLSPGGPAILEWPPPGIEELLGRARKVSIVSCIGAALILVAMGVLVLGVTEATATNVPVSALLVVACVLGLLFMVEALRRTTRLVEKVARARQAGYAWRTVLETMTDHHGDSGSMIAGTGRYASMTADRRNRLRKSRVGGELLLLSAGLGALPLLAVVLVLGSWGLATPDTTWVAIALPVTAVGVGVALASADVLRSWRTRSGRTRLQVIAFRILIVIVAVILVFGESAPAVLVASIALLLIYLIRRRELQASASAPDVAVAAAWYRSLSPAEAGNAVDAARARTMDRIGSLGLDGLVLSSALLLAPLLVDASRGWRFLSGSNGDFITTRNMTLYARIADDVRQYGVAKDARISPLEAGKASFAIDAAMGWLAAPTPDFPTRAPQPLRAPELEFSPWAVISSPTVAQLRAIEAAAHADIWPAVAVVARAPAIDHIGARYVLPFRAGIALGTPFPMSARYSNPSFELGMAARAVYYVSKGMSDSAETALREGISFGLATIESGTLHADVFGGYNLVVRARTNLKAYCAWSRRRPDSTLCREASVGGGVGTRFATGDGPRVNLDVVKTDDVRMSAFDANELRAVRFRMLRVLALSSCANLRELIFRADDQVRRDFATANKLWSRSAGDSAILNLAYRRPDLFPGMVAGRSRSDLGVVAARVVSTALRNPRIEQCASAMER